MLAYFNQHFGYEVSGLEYVDRCARESQEMLDRDGISAEVIHDDLFEFVPESQWDVVGSFGFVEHFEDTQDTIEQHLKLLKPGGWLVLSIPNHSGVSGSVMRLIDRKLYASHNQMSADDLAAGAEQTGALEILTAGYYGHFSLCNAGIYRTARPLLPGPAFLGLRAGMAALDLAGRLLPDGRLLSVGAYLIARKRPV